MAGRIRTLKPEWMENERLAASSDAARVLSVGLILIADDYGNGRAGEGYLIGQIWHATTDLDAARDRMREGLRSLASIGYLSLYKCNGQTYFTLHGWARHQLVKNPSKPRVPAPNGCEIILSQETLRKSYGDSPETLTPDHDHDPDLDHDPERDPGARARARSADEVPRPRVAKLADAVWAEQEQRTANMRARGIEPGAFGLGDVHPLKGELAARMRERVDGGEDPEKAAAAARHVLDVVLADCERDKTTRHANGRHWEPDRFADALSREVGSKFRRATTTAPSSTVAAPKSKVLFDGYAEAKARDAAAKAAGGSR